MTDQGMWMRKKDDQKDRTKETTTERERERTGQAFCVKCKARVLKVQVPKYRAHSQNHYQYSEYSIEAIYIYPICGYFGPLGLIKRTENGYQTVNPALACHTRKPCVAKQSLHVLCVTKHSLVRMLHGHRSCTSLANLKDMELIRT